MSFHECMPAQQISPSAARRSPCCSAILPASRKVSAIIAVFAFGFSRQLATPNSAESMRMTPYLRTPYLLKMPAMRQAIFTALALFVSGAGTPVTQEPVGWRCSAWEALWRSGGGAGGRCRQAPPQPLAGLEHTETPLGDPLDDVVELFFGGLGSGDDDHGKRVEKIAARPFSGRACWGECVAPTGA